MKYTVEMGSGAMIYITIFIETSSGIEKLDLKVCDDGAFVQV
jgi:hypothetical protein